ncbi:MAG: hypothetical protein ACJARN_001826, partial [Arenicella sp.]
KKSINSRLLISNRHILSPHFHSIAVVTQQ